MKVEKISEFADKINNVEKLRELIKFLLSKTDEEVDMIKEVLDKYNYDEVLVPIIIRINKERTIEEIVKIVDAVGKCEDKWAAFDIALDVYVQRKGTGQEIKELIETVDKCEAKETAFAIANDIDVKYNRTVSEMIELIKTVDKCKDKETAFCIAINEDVQESRTFQEIKEIIETVDKCKDKGTAFYIATRKYRSIQKIEKIIESTEKKAETNTKELNSILNDIDTAEEFKGYFKNLNDNGVNDVTLDTIVPVYKPTKKN